MFTATYKLKLPTIIRTTFQIHIYHLSNAMIKSSCSKSNEPDENKIFDYIVNSKHSYVITINSPQVKNLRAIKQNFPQILFNRSNIFYLWTVGNYIH